ncbi:LamB/YcsF family protein [Streptomyces sp. AC536]|uniref:LamB/YcsF family protein n=1 Tax=Streptomyces buecherae TaxID=2763006 RepID=UPI00164D372C|nr:5-oxoprolinase subunit PxpA [Streptomyces buecherae]MBC3984625.1 LamB/YcsF family protein [Streptomyces buecherae]QNJ38853.1 LamB/YcsF family protein [Streptomyces buecherae]
MTDDADRPAIDLNADLGEGFGRWHLTDDDALLSVVTSANVACGFHAGDPSTMRRVCDLAAERGVVIGAQVSYRDLAGFGRRAMDVPPRELADEVAYQIGALDVFARAAGARVAYVKPHGALYNRCVHDEQQAAAVVDGVRLASDAPLPVLGLPGSLLLAAARAAELPAVPEAFADRAYTAHATLVSRGTPGAVIDDPNAVVKRSLTIARDRAVTTIDGEQVDVHARSLCLHGDTPGAAATARRVRAELAAAGVRFRAFA